MKLESIQANFISIHEGESWQEIAYDVIQTAQQSATALILSGDIAESIDIFSNNVIGCKGAIRSLSISCDREEVSQD